MNKYVKIIIISIIIVVCFISGIWTGCNYHGGELQRITANIRSAKNLIKQQQNTIRETEKINRELVDNYRQLQTDRKQLEAENQRLTEINQQFGITNTELETAIGESIDYNQQLRKILEDCEKTNETENNNR